MRANQAFMMSEEWEKLLPREKANIKKTVSELLAFLMLAGLSSIFLTAAKDADTDEDKMILNNIAFITLRGKSEMAFFWNINEAVKILQSPAASITAIESAIKILYSLLPPDFEGFDIYQRGNWKGHYKVTKQAMNIVPALRQYYKITDVEDYVTLLK